ncbi:MAG: MCP four helix bundle domain-containing protein, partial [Fibromonadales bacterium]|nr:MCP four helix bundle domain-containing protein [Fibromonadales bacterium]
MSNIKIGTKLIASFVFLAALTAFMGIRTINSLKTVSDATDIMYDTGAVPLGVFVEMSNNIQEMRVEAQHWRLAKTQERRTQLFKKMDSLNNEV